jgi:hypothetical protein
MSLLDDASLLVTPNAEKEGKLYSIIPTNGNGDFSVTRATTATRVNAAGLVELVPYNLVQYSQLFTNAIWTNFNTTTTGSQTGYDGATNAALITKTGANGYLRQTSLPSANTHTASVYAKANSVNFLALATDFGTRIGYFDLSNGTTGATTNLISSSITSVGNGWYRCSITASTLSDVRIFPATTNGSTAATTGSIFIQYCQVVEGTSALDYQATETRLNIPRLDYSLGSCPNILLEPQRTNLILRSEEFSSASWTKTNSTISANTAIAPNGTLTADTLTRSTATGVLLQSVAQVIGTAYTYSIWIKGSTAGNINFGTSSGAVFNNISITTSWQRYTFTRTATTLSDGLAIYLTATTLQSVDIWGAQLEAGAYATSYIPTTSASVTRNADVISRGNIFTNGLITSSGGTWFAELRNNRALIRDFSGALYVGTNSIDANAGNALLLRNPGGTSRILIRKVIGGVGTDLYQTLTDTIKVAIKWNGATADVFVNGVKVVSATAFTTTNMEFLNSTSTPIPFFINSMALFPTPLTDTQCIALTT